MSSSFVSQAEAAAGTSPLIPFGGKMEDKEWLERDDHPLLNDVIVMRVFVHVRRYDLKACRGVCKKWNEHAIPHIRSTFQVTIHGNESQDQNTEHHRTKDFVKLFQSNELGIPFEKYLLGSFCTTDGDGKQFIDICGDSIKEIVLFQPTNAHCFRKIENVAELLKFSPKLKALTLCGQFVSLSGNAVKLFPDSPPVLSALKKLTVICDSQNPYIKHCPTFFDELLGVACNISHFTINDHWHYITEASRSGITLVLNCIEKLGRESCIQSLSLKSANFKNIEILKKMAEKPNGLKLKEISFQPNILFTENRDSTIQIELATIFKDTLEDFDVIGTFPGNYVMEFPMMSKLKSLKFSALKESVYKPVNLNQIFPVLETLTIGFKYITKYDIDHDSLSELFSQFQPCPTIKNLTVVGNIVNLRTFHHILRAFTNLRKLAVSLEGAEAVRQIWTGLTQLESLSLVASVSAESWNVLELDSLLTGIPIQELNEISQVIPDLEKMTVQERRKMILLILNLAEEYKTEGPSIRNLTNLKHLKLNVSLGYKSDYSLRDLTGYLGLYSMKHLKYLDIQGCELTKTCCEILTRETGLEAWSFQTEEYGERGNIHIIPPFQMSQGEPN